MNIQAGIFFSKLSPLNGAKSIHVLFLKIINGGEYEIF